MVDVSVDNSVSLSTYSYNNKFNVGMSQNTRVQYGLLETYRILYNPFHINQSLSWYSL